MADRRAPESGAIIDCSILELRGWVKVPGLLTPAGCDSISSMFDRPGLFRSEVHMARHGFGRGIYKYFADPLPPAIAGLRCSLYPALAGLADRWAQQLGTNRAYPAEHEAYRAVCRAAGQTRPTPLLLSYEPGDFNCLHQDIYGAEVFPLQAAVLLSAPDRDFTGGEFVVTEQRPRAQSRVSVVPLAQGDGVIFSVRERPVAGKRGYYRVQMRHGVSEITTGRRFSLGIIFHDAR